MKKYFSNLNKAVPPKARIGILIIMASIVLCIYILYSALSSGEEESEGVSTGLVQIKPVINESSKVEKQGMISEDNYANKTHKELTRASIEEKKSSSGKSSFFEGIDMSQDVNKQSEEQNTQDTTAEDEVQNDVVDLSALFNTENKNQTQKEQANSNLQKLKIKNDIPTSSNTQQLFDRQQFMAQVESSVNNSAIKTSIKWDEVDKSTPFKVTMYASQSTNDNSNKESSVENPNNTTSTLKQSSEEKREKYYGRYNSMRERLTSKINGNTETIALNNISENKEEAIEGDDLYESNKTFGAGEIIYGVNNIIINTDKNNVVRAVIGEQGDTYKAILLGEHKKINDVVGIAFNRYSINGKSYVIDAIAIDPYTWEAGLADDVDKHYFSRFSGIIAASLLSGYSETLMNKTTNNTDSGLSESSERIESFSERIQYAFGKVGENLAPKLLENIDRDSTVTVNGDREIGIMFMSDFRVPAVY